MRGNLRKKIIAGGRKVSLYIDYFPPVWNPIKKIYTRREYLKLHLYTKPTNDVELKLNKIHQEIAEKIYLQRMKVLMLDANGLFNKDALEADVYTFAWNYIRGKQKDKVDTFHYEVCLKYLKNFVGEHLKFKHIDEIFITRFKDFLLNTGSLKSPKVKLAQNSAASYFDKFLILVEEAFLARYLSEDYGLRVDRIGNIETEFALPDDQELQLLIDNPCNNDLVYRSSIFALLSGFRFGAVQILRWKHLHWSETLKSWYFEIIDPKPGRSFRQYISQQAVDFLGTPPQDNKDVLIFPGLNYSTMRSHLQQWFAKLGLLEKAKFHNWRRLYATKLLEEGEDIYVVSKMLNHKHVKTTERYTQVRAKKRAAASNRISINIKKQ
ncbi:Phage integrase family protein [Chitinophaga rupis]|uniref:Phage integrase family protein n=1 Tax=Chitinophaga rupis TaxID=573321 RepID=A0A1H8C6X2_9BACT|nr:tyrosine-type recombinase/integrase [Chitinophaga rupis]SEM90780.1 Phage integrase family protein [Chitinophaga rupis]